MQETWRVINEFNGIYLISNLGKIKSVERKIRSHHGTYRTQKEKLMKTRINNKGYQTVKLRKDDKYVERFVHRLIAEAFIPNPNNLPIVNHKDENTLNNTVDNLEWCTYEYNCNYGTRNARISMSRVGMKFSDTHIEHLRQSGKKRVNDEFRSRMRDIHLGTHLSEEHKKKISEGMKKRKSL